MTYRVEFEGAALVQLNDLPSAVFDAPVSVWWPWSKNRGTQISWHRGMTVPIARSPLAKATACYR
jgi:hypothetical protein